MDIDKPILAWEVEVDCIFINFLRCYLPGQFPEAMEQLRQIARKEGKSILRGYMTGDARVRLFRMRGWKYIRKLLPDTHINVMEYEVKK